MAAVLLAHLAGCTSDAPSNKTDAHAQAQRAQVLTPTQREARIATWLYVARIHINTFRGGQVVNPRNGKPRLDEAVEAVNHILQRQDPDNYAATMCLGEAQQLAMRYEQASAAYQRAAKLASQAAGGQWRDLPPQEIQRRIADPQLQLAQVLWDNSDHVQVSAPGARESAVEQRELRRRAIAQAEQVFNQFPAYRPAAMWLANVKLDPAVQDFRACSAHVEIALTRFPDDRDLLDIGARCARLEKEWDKAIAYRRRLADLEPGSVRRWAELADMCLRAIEPGAQVVGKTREWVEQFRNAADRVDAIGDPIDRQQMDARRRQLQDRLSGVTIVATEPASPTRPTSETRPSPPRPEAERIAERKGLIRHALATGSFDDAYQDAEELATRIAPDDAEAHALAAQAAFAMDRVPRAIEFARSGLALDPESVPLHMLLGRCYVVRRQWRLAAEQFGKVSGSSPQAKLCCAVALADDGRPAEAAAELTALVAAEPADLQVRFRLARILSDLGRFRDSRPHWQWLVLNHPSLISARLGLAESLINGLFMREAVPHLQFLTEVAPGDATMLVTEGAGAGLPPTYKTAPADATALREAQVEAWLKLALCRQWDEEPAEAVKAYYQVFRLNPTDTRARNGLGRLYMDIYATVPQREEMRDRAIEQFNLSLKENPDQPDIRALVEQLGGERPGE